MLPAIEIKNLGKKYIRRRANRARYGSLRDSLSMWWRRAEKPETFWALRQVDLSIAAGEVVGIIGRNGAGKSTLLKLLSRITEPSEGEITLRGRISSLLEVGTGFHPELTGRENIYLSGTILGMRRAEIRQRFDEIVAFAGLQDFLEVPVKRYSSGMYVRLGFAVAAHLDAELLLVDEVLAVGDAEFQQKCLAKMDDAARSGRTVLVVSHNLDVITGLTQRAICLEEGRVYQSGPSTQVVQDYLALLAAQNTEDFRTGQIIQHIFCQVAGEHRKTVNRGDRLTIGIGFTTSQTVYNPVFGINIRNREQRALVGINNRHYHTRFPTKAYREGQMSVSFNTQPLLPGSYTVDLFFGDKSGDLEQIPQAFSFQVLHTAHALPHVESMQPRLNMLVLPEVEWKLLDASPE